MDLKLTGLAALFILTMCTQPANTTFHSTHFELNELTNGVYACIHKLGGKAISNAGIINNGRETVVFDCFLDPVATQDMLAFIESSGLPPVKYVINSHDHNDHIRGNQVFPEDVQIVSTRKTAELIAEWEPQQIKYEKENAPALFEQWDSLLSDFSGDTSSKEYQKILMWRPYYESLMHSHENIRTRLPDTYVDGQMALDGPDRRLQLISYGRGHTESDLILHLPDDGIVFTADLVFNRCHPYLAHGNIDSLRSWYEKLIALEPNTIVPGHGAVGGAELLGKMEDYISTLESISQDLTATGTPVDSVSEAMIPEKYADYVLERFFIPNMHFVHSNRTANEE
jgi:glyoxylase-like metal-dependent hydrolase (beta-lactamase superfamily II)